MGAGSPRTHRPPADARADEPDVQEELPDIDLGGDSCNEEPVGVHLGEDDILHDEYVVQNSVPDASQEYGPPPSPTYRMPPRRGRRQGGLQPWRTSRAAKMVSGSGGGS